MALLKEKMNKGDRPVVRNLTHAIAALRTRSWAMHQTDKAVLLQARQDVEAQQPYVAQVQQALMGNTEGKTIANVTPHWVNKRLKSLSSDNDTIASDVLLRDVNEYAEISTDYQYLRRL
ncbi:hypothetical protein [Shewanella colwelliana]|uniref:hypothetical protein n=1 Tax=Shewanella colwelliana TaxID=23 RepID=UPI003735F852